MTIENGMFGITEIGKIKTISIILKFGLGYIFDHYSMTHESYAHDAYIFDKN